MLHINLLGIPEIYVDIPLNLRFRTRKAQALLIYLAVTEQRWTRDALATLFWPETSDARARKNLRDILPPLRQQLGPYLRIDDERLGMNPSSKYKCDVTQFTTLLEGHLQEIETATLATTLALYRGEFLAGYRTSTISVDFELWALRERERLHQLALMGFTTLCQRQQEDGAYDAALVTNRQLLKLAPWDETAHRQQMLLLIQSGQQAAALAHYENCRQILAEELGVEPMPDTTALYEQIRTGAHSPNAPSMWPIASVASAKPEAKQENNQATQEQTAIPHNLPAPRLKLIGYREELSYIQRQLTREECRLLTLVGIGGVGKTHLALEAARQIVDLPYAATQFSDGVYFIPLDSVSEESLPEAAEMAMVFAIAHTLGYTFQGNHAPQIQLQTHLRNKRMLLILDNMEHLLAGAPLVTTLIQQANHLAILTTSREKLNLRGEQILYLLGLNQQPAQPAIETPEINPEVATRPTTDKTRQSVAQADVSIWQQNDAVALFAYHAQLADPHFCIDERNVAHILHICALVDGLPLGVEMAAKWLAVLDCATIAEEVKRNLDFLEATQRDIPARHKTLRAVFNHSWNLLSTREQAILARLSIFQPSFQVAAALTVTRASPRDLSNLVNKSLLSRSTAGQLAIHRSVRHFAREQLTQCKEEQQAVEKRYVSHYLGLAAQYWARIFLPTWQEAQSVLINDIDNFKSALWLAVEREMWAEVHAAYFVLTYLDELQGWFLESLDFWRTTQKRLSRRPQSGSYTEQRKLDIFGGELLRWQGWCEIRLGRSASATATYQHALSTVRQIVTNIEAEIFVDEAHGNAELLADARQALSHTLMTFGIGKNWMGEPAAAQVLLREAISLPTKPEKRATCLFGLTEATYRLGDYVQAQKYAQEGLCLAEQKGDQRFIGLFVMELGRIEQARGAYATAQKFFLQSYEHLSKLHDQTGVAQHLLVDLSTIARLQGDCATAKAYLERNLKLGTELNLDTVHVQTLWELGNLALQQRGIILRPNPVFSKVSTIRRFNLLRWVCPHWVGPIWGWPNLMNPKGICKKLFRLRSRLKPMPIYWKDWVAWLCF